MSAVVSAAMSAALGALHWWRWLAAGQWRSAPGRSLASVLAVAVGVAMALAIHLVNVSALEEFREAIATVNGDAHLQIRPRAGTLDEGLYPRVAAATSALPRGAGPVPALSPVIDVEIAVARDDAGGAADGGGADAQDTRGTAPSLPRTLRVIGLDLFAAGAVTPSLLPAVEAPAIESPAGAPAAAGIGTDPDAGAATGADSPLFGDDSIFLSQAALQALGARVGARLWLQPGLERVPLRIAGTVPGAAPGQRLAVMDLGTAQWRLGLLGRISRIDLRFAAGSDRAALTAAIAGQLPPDAVVTTPEASEQRMSNVSRAYRVNLNVLALVALFTGAFLVFATMALAVVRQQSELALLGVLGASPRQVLGAVLAQGAVMGAAGALLGVAAGVGLAWALLQAVGGDLGGGYFSGSRPRVVLHGPAIAGFGALGVLVGLAGAAAPAWATSRAAPARALKAGSAEDTLGRLGRWRWSIALALLGAALLALPALHGLPIGAYLAIAAWLVAGIACVPMLTRAAARAVQRVADRLLWRRPPAWLALTRVAQSSGTVGVALAGVVASFALSSAMAIMVSSFRVSVADWLDAVLPADLYARAAAGPSAGLDPSLQRLIAATPGVARTEFLRAVELTLDPARPAVALLVRTLEPGTAARQLPLTGETAQAPPGAVRLWVSEAMVDVYGMGPGSQVSLPLGPAGGAPVFFVVGVWRDYARQHGAIVMSRDDYVALTGDAGMSDVSLWLADGATPQAVAESIGAQATALAQLEWRSAAQIRALSLRIFDRSFTVTYALEAIAILVGLFGVAATCAGEALARAREFGVLRHLGVPSRQVAVQLAVESGLTVSMAVAWGALIGAAIGLVLIERVNPQSFHWTMQVHWPVALLLISGLSLVAAAVLAALLAARGALGDAPLQAVRQDW